MEDIESAYLNLRRRSAELLSLLGILKEEARACAALERPKKKPTDAQTAAIEVALVGVAASTDTLHEAIRDAENAVRR